MSTRSQLFRLQNRDPLRGSRIDRMPMSVGIDYRRRVMGYADGTQRREDRVDEIIQAIHCRLLEQATNGRLTFDGDEIKRKGT